MRIAVCDDNNDVCKYIKQVLTAKYKKKVSVLIYTDAKHLLEDYTKKNDTKIADILLMDIEVADMNGIDVVAQVQKIYSEMKVVFITGYIQYSTEIFRATPSNFLVKPLDPDKLIDVIDKLMVQIEEEDKDCFVISFKSRVFKIKLSEIMYFESDQRTVIVHGRNESWTIYRRLDEIQEEVPDYFLRCHQSYLVNMNEIKSIKSLRVELYNGDTVLISRPKHKESKERFLEYIAEI